MRHLILSLAITAVGILLLIFGLFRPGGEGILQHAFAIGLVVASFGDGRSYVLWRNLHRRG